MKFKYDDDLEYHRKQQGMKDKARKMKLLTTELSRQESLKKIIREKNKLAETFKGHVTVSTFHFQSHSFLAHQIAKRGSPETAESASQERPNSKPT